jgi:hypothetical protein
LTLEELELISGGSGTQPEIVVVADGGGDSGEIVVVADGGGDSGDSGDWGDWGDGDDWDDWGDYGDGGGDGGDGADGGGGDEANTPTDDNPPLVSGGVVNLHNAEKVNQGVATLQAQIDAMTPKIQALADTATVMLPDGTVMTGAELKQLWNTIDFVVTDQTFGTDRGGAYDSGSRVSAINVDTMNGWNAWPGGLAFITLHEIAHSSEAAANVETAMWEAHLAAGGTAANYDASSPYFQENEEFANLFARDTMAALGLPLDPNFPPTNGYEYGDLSQ